LQQEDGYYTAAAAAGSGMIKNIHLYI